MTFTGTPRGCAFCGRPLHTRDEPKGRPNEYCDARCRQGAYRAREKARTQDAAKPPASDDLEAAVQQIAQELLEDARRLVDGLSSPEASALDQVTQAVLIRRRTEALTAGLVARARLRRHTWRQLAQRLATSAETARRTYRAAVVRRLLQHPPGPGGPPAPQHPGTAARRDQGTDETHPPNAGTAPSAPAQDPPANHLAPVLAQLHRTSRMSLRALSRRARVSASYLSRVLRGNRLPSWEVTERLARACGADPLVLRRVWEAEKIREATAAAQRHTARPGARPLPEAPAPLAGTRPTGTPDLPPDALSRSGAPSRPNPLSRPEAPSMPNAPSLPSTAGPPDAAVVPTAPTGPSVPSQADAAGVFLRHAAGPHPPCRSRERHNAW